MSEESGLEKLFFELASESRLSILRELQKESLKMQEIARRLDVTATEIFRQLERLTAASLVQRQPDGTYAIAEYGELVLQISTSLDFISKYKQYFSTHAVMKLPRQFINRLNELSNTEFRSDYVENLNRGTQAYIEAKQYAWGIGEGTIPAFMTSVMNQKVQQGLEIKMIILKDRLPPTENMPPTPKNVELRGLSEVPVVAVLTEKLAGVCFSQTSGKMDYAGFFGSDLTFHGWVKDLFLYYWEKAKSTG